MVTAQLLGGACLRSGNTLLNGPPAQRHRIALLSLVVAAWPQPLARDRAMALLWPERDQTGARRLLNLAVHVLRAALGEDVIASTGDALLYNPSALRCDFHELHQAIAAHEPDKIVRLYAGPLLEGFHLPESTEFNYWLDERRHELARAYLAALTRVAARQQQTGDLHGWLDSARRLVAADPYSGAYTCMLMRALDAVGDRAAAIQCATDHASRRRADLELDADTEVMALAEQLRLAPPRTPTQHSPISTLPSVAVLPFANLTADHEHDYFADGITEDVIAHLSNIRALKVISLTSVLPFKERRQSLPEIGAALGATALVDGSVRYAGDRVRIVARLVDVEHDRNLWAETYDRQLTDIFTIQTDVAMHIVAALKTELTTAEQVRIHKEPTRDMPAYRLFLQGLHLFIGFTPETLLSALEFFERAVARDPAFALAWSYVAIVCTELQEGGVLAPEVAYPRAHEAATRATQHDPELGVAHCADGFVKTVSEFDWVGAEKSFRRALELSPNNADVYDYFGRLCSGLARFGEAIYLQQRAQELSPLAHRVDLATTLLRAGQYVEAIQRMEEALDIDSTQARARATLGWGYFLTGKQPEGIAELERVTREVPDNTLWLAQLGEAYGLVGRRDEARAVLDRLEEQARTRFVSPYHFAYVWTGLDADTAIEWLERAVASRTGAAYGIKGSFLFAPLRSQPRFRRLLRSLKLEA